MNRRAIFVAATGQNVGKTTTCLGIVSGLKNHFAQVGFIKPVGQMHTQVEDNLKVDKDTVLFKETFHLAADYRDISPFIIPAGLSRSFLAGQLSPDQVHQRIRDAFHTIALNNDYTVVEGTGHVGVGSILGLNNAQVAAELGLEMVLVSSGGLGSAIDSLALNFAMCQKYGVTVRGVILNRVLDEKRQMILDYFPKALEPFGVPLIGCIPFCKFLSIPTMEDFEVLFSTKLLAGHQYRNRHFRHTRLVAGSLKSYLTENNASELVITPASRDEIISAILERERDHKVGLLLTGREPPSDAILRQITNSQVPTLYAPVCSYDAMKQITSFTAKIRWEDVRKVRMAIELVQQHIDFKALCKSEAPVTA